MAKNKIPAPTENGSKNRPVLPSCGGSYTRDKATGELIKTGTPKTSIKKKEAK